MIKQRLLAFSAALLLSASPLYAMACDHANQVHTGNVLTVDANGKTFTIRDAATQKPITFLASNEIIAGLKDAKGNVMVNYKGEGKTLTAVGVTF